jgi:hypothetical protein
MIDPVRRVYIIIDAQARGGRLKRGNGLELAGGSERQAKESCQEKCRLHESASLHVIPGGTNASGIPRTAVHRHHDFLNEALIAQRHFGGRKRTDLILVTFISLNRVTAPINNPSYLSSIVLCTRLS